ncbi:MAG: hypothetical protein K8L99_03950 [Anaerolineae bacterium]|nr:hypothetical protein [Anaerolineae bacterium]
MSAPANALWRVNNEYSKRLTQVKVYLQLLTEQMIDLKAGSDDAHARTSAALHYALEQIDQMINEHKEWRYAYYYESLETKRMVQSLNAVNYALGRFLRMRTQHEQRLKDIHALIEHLQRPDPLLTRVPNGDLWTMTQFAIDHLNQFADYVSSLA